eukprot:scaffold4627_cov157-Isochrysis_galbana.AAC.2
MKRAFVSLRASGVCVCGYAWVVALPVAYSAAQVTDVAVAVVRCALCERSRLASFASCFVVELARSPCRSVKVKKAPTSPARSPPLLLRPPSSSDERQLLRARVSRHRRGCEAKARVRVRLNKRTNDNPRASPRCMCVCA